MHLSNSYSLQKVYQVLKKAAMIKTDSGVSLLG